MEKPWIDQYEPREWTLYDVVVHSPEYKNLEESIQDERIRIFGADGQYAEDWWRRNKSVKGLIFYDLEQLWAMELDAVYGVSRAGYLTKEWKGHPVGSIVLIVYRGVDQDPPMVTVGIAKPEEGIRGGSSQDVVSIAGLDKAAVFAALYNRARPQGMGFMKYNPKPMTVEEAREQLGLGDDHAEAEQRIRRAGGIVIGRSPLQFDYVNGRVMKIDISGDEIDPRLYDRDNGPGAAAEAIASLTQEGTPNGAVVQAGHHLSKQEAANEVYRRFHEETIMTVGDGVASVKLGLAQHAKELLPKVRRATEETDEDDNRK